MKWRRRPTDWVGRAEVDSLGVEADNESGENTTEWARGLTAELDEQYTTRLLKQAPEVYHTQINDLLLTALARALCSWVGAGADVGESCRVKVDLEGHGRREELAPGLDLTRTVGWFTSLFPVLLEVRGGEPESETLKRVKEELRAVPDSGLGYGTLRYLREDEVSRRLAAAGDSFVSFNYLGQTDAVLRDGEGGLALKPARESSGTNASAGSRRSHLVDINAIVSGGRLRVSLTYPSRLLGEERVRALADAYAGELRRLVDHLLHEAEGGHTPSDFPQARLTQQKLDELWQRDVRPEAVYGLSPLQEGLLFHSLYEGGGELYVVQLSYRLEGELDEGALRRAWVEAARRHEALRTGYEWEGVEPMAAVVRREAELRWERLDWSGFSEAEQAVKLEEYLTAERGRGFDVRESPLTRQAVIVLGSGSHQFVWTFHHLIMDGWSGSMLAGEVARLYEAYAAGSEPVLEPAPRYREYMAWLGRQDLEAAERYWRERLSGVESPTLIASGRATGERRLVTAALTETVTARLTEAARRWQVTLSTLVQGAWALVLGRHTGREEVVYGVTVSGRPAELEGVERMVGLFINTLPARVRIEEGAGVEEWLRGMQAEAARMREYEYSPLSQVQGWSETPKGGALFDSIVVFENYPVDQTLREWEGTLRIGQVRASETTNYAAAVVAVPGRELGLQLMYEAGAVGEGGAERLLGELGWVLEQLAEGEGLRVGEVEVVREEERRLLLHEWNDASRVFADESCLHERFEEQVERRPHAVALVYEGEPVTYQELNQRANQLAHYLKKSGVGPETLVGLCVERSVEMVVGILGILKAGGAYLPLDPAYPAERLAFIMQDSQCPVVVTQQSVAQHLPGDTARIISLDTEWARVSEESTANCAGQAGPDNLAYVIYTSGSTGVPKGVPVTHRNCTRLFRSTQPWFDFDDSDTWTLFHSYAFDFSVWELWGALLYGGRLVVVPYWVSRSPDAFYSLLVRERVTVLNQTPSAFYQLIRAEEEAGTGSDTGSDLALRYVIFGGEALELRSLRPWFERHGESTPRLVNMYGITETTVHVTYRPLTLREVEEGAGSVIGRPLPDLQVYLLGREQRLVPVGAAGEMYVGGEGVARGYLNRAGLTAERFVPHPYATRPGERLYRSGDLARYGAEGDLEYLGRIDQQVKVRGFRIELGEVEAALAGHPSVQEAVAVAREGEGGEKRIVGYVVLEGSSGVGVGELRAYLKERLPEYMVPSALVRLERMPLTASGKVDRRALPDVGADGRGEGEYVAPSSEREEELCRIWGEVLRVERVGVRDNFFELGGDSILSLQVIARAARAGMRLTPRQVFDHPTVEELARLAGEAGAVSEEAEAGEAVGEAALTPIQERFLREQPEGALDHYNQSLLLEAGEGVDECALGEALRVVVSHHDALRARYERDDDGRWHQTIGVPDGDDAKPPLSVLDLTEVEDFKGGVGAAADQLQRSLSLREGPLLRAALLRTRAGARLLLAAHHLVVDGVSWRVLLDDLQAAYSQLHEGAEVRLPTKTTPYRRWAGALAEYAQSEAVETQANYWVGRAEADSLDVTTDSAAVENTTAWARGLTVELEESYTTRLLKQAPEVYHTRIDDLLLTALARALCSWVEAGAGEVSKVKVDLEGHGRREEVASGLDLTRTIGWFTSLFPVLLEVRAGEAPSETLKRVKEELRAVPDQGLGYGALRYLREDEVSSRLEDAGDATVAFNYIGQTDVVLQGDGDGGSGLALKAARESSGSNASAESVRAHLLDLNALVSGGRLRVAFTYPSRLLGEERVRALADLYAGELRRLVDHLLNEAEGGHTPSDFPQARLTQQKLDELWQRDVRPEAVYGLSPLQEGLLFHSLYEGGGELYVVQLSYRLEGELDEAALRRAWVEAARRHEALRTGYEWEGVEPMAAVVRREAELRWERLDWSGVSEAEQAVKLEEYLEDERRRGFDVREAPLTRQAVIELGEGSHQFVWTFHHLIMDGWCMAIITREVIELYEAYAAGREPELEPAPRYRDYIAWLGRQDLQAAERYWREQLAGVESPTPLGQLLAGGGEEGGGYSKRERVLSGELTGRLEGLARGWQVTLNTLMQGVWALLLGRASGRGEVVYGVTVSGRPAELEGVERMVGLFINTLPARVRIEEGAGVEEWLRGMQAEAARMREYEYSPLSQVQAWSETPKGGALFDSIVVFENYPVDQTLRERRRQKLLIRDVAYKSRNSNPISIVGVPGPELLLQIQYDGNFLNAATVEELLWGFETLLSGFVSLADARVGDLLKLLDEAEKQQRLRRERELEDASASKFKKGRRRTVVSSDKALKQ